MHVRALGDNQSAACVWLQTDVSLEGKLNQELFFLIKTEICPNLSTLLIWNYMSPYLTFIHVLLQVV